MYQHLNSSVYSTILVKSINLS